MVALLAAVRSTAIINAPARGCRTGWTVGGGPREISDAPVARAVGNLDQGQKSEAPAETPAIDGTF